MFCNFSEDDKNQVKNLFETMKELPVSESNAKAMAWLSEENYSFSGFVNGKFLPKDDIEGLKFHKIRNDFCGIDVSDIFLPTTDVLENAAENSFAAWDSWLDLACIERSECLHSLRKIVEQHARLLTEIETLSSGKQFSQVKFKDVHNIKSHLYFYAVRAAVNTVHPIGFIPTGVVCIISEAYCSSLLSLSMKIGSLLAGKNVVLLLVDVRSCLSAFLLAEFFSLAGFPPGVLNVLPVDLNTLDALPIVNKVIFNGSYEKSIKFIEMAAKQGIYCEVSRPSKPVVIIYESADLHSACDGVLETFYAMEPKSEGSCCKIFIQESIQEIFLQLLAEKFQNILIGPNFSNADMSLIVNEQQHEQLKSVMHDEKMKSYIIKGPDAYDVNYLHSKPILIKQVPTTSELFEKISGPVIITTPFRTVKESIAMFNWNKRSSTVSVWSENINVAFEVAHKLKTRTVWLNSQNIFDPSVPSGSVYNLGNSIDGGEEAIYSHFNHGEFYPDEEVKANAGKEINSYGKKPSTNDVVLNPSDDQQIYNQHIGGSFKKIGNSYKIVRTAESELYAFTSEGNHSAADIAFESALNIQLNWASKNKFKRSEILVKLSKALEKKRKEFVSEIHVLTGEEEEKCAEEFKTAVSCLLHWANAVYSSDVGSGKIRVAEMGERVLEDLDPIGVIGIQCPDQNPLLSFISLIIPAIAFGNTVVAIASEKYPTLALKTTELFHACGVSPGVVNVITGDRAYLTRHLCMYLDLDAFWFTSGGASFIYNSCSVNMKKTFNCTGIWCTFNNEATKRKLISESTLTKAIYVKSGSIFAN